MYTKARILGGGIKGRCKGANIGGGGELRVGVIPSGRGLNELDSKWTLKFKNIHNVYY